VTGGTGVSSFEWRADVAALAARVRVRVDPALDAQWPAAAPARVRIRLGSGEAAVALVDNPRGHHSEPASRAELRAKLVGLGGDPAAFDVLADLATVEDCADLPLEFGQLTSDS
jgi:2-methylcitrate dehydratase PrpD